MPIVVNGTTIPENVANVLNVNGTNITSVVCNGVTVWTQSLFNAIWSGSSYANSAATGYTGLLGIETSNSSYRSRVYTSNYGVWQTLSTSSVFSGNSTIYSWGFVVSGSNIKLNGSSTWVSLSTTTHAFSGSSSYEDEMSDAGTSYSSILTSGGLMAIEKHGTFTASNTGTYISVT